MRIKTHENKNSRKANCSYLLNAFQMSGVFRRFRPLHDGAYMFTPLHFPDSCHIAVFFDSVIRNVFRRYLLGNCL